MEYHTAVIQSNNKWTQDDLNSVRVSQMFLTSPLIICICCTQSTTTQKRKASFPSTFCRIETPEPFHRGLGGFAVSFFTLRSSEGLFEAAVVHAHRRMHGGIRHCAHLRRSWPHLALIWPSFGLSSMWAVSRFMRASCEELRVMSCACMHSRPLRCATTHPFPLLSQGSDTRAAVLASVPACPRCLFLAQPHSLPRIHCLRPLSVRHPSISPPPF